MQAWSRSWHDQGYRGDLEVDLAAVYGVVLEVVEHEGKGFSVQAKRWIVERRGRG